MVHDFFDGKQPSRGVDPDEAVACGAAIEAAIIWRADSEDLVEFCFWRGPFALGIETAGEMTELVIRKDSTIPAKTTQKFTTNLDNQPAVRIKVFEGQKASTRDNNLLGMFDLTGIPPAPRGVPIIEVTFDVDQDGTLKVSAQDKTAGNVKMITIKNEKGGFSQGEIDQMDADRGKFDLVSVWER